MFKSLNHLARKMRHPATGLLLIRIAAGLVFLMHGWMKVNNLSMVEGMFVHFGLGGPVGVFIAWLEVIGGLALILGFFTRIFAIAFGIEMLVAIFLTGGIAMGYQPHETEIFLMLVSFGIALTGPGRYALYAFECHHCGALVCKDSDCPGYKGRR